MTVTAQCNQETSRFVSLRPGISVRSLRTVVETEVQRALKHGEGDPLEAMKSGLKRLRDQELLSRADIKFLDRIVDSLAKTRKATPAQLERVRARVERVQRELILQPGASPVALVVAAAACDSFPPPSASTKGVAAAAASGFGADIGMVAGAIAGAGVGGAIGGLGGAAIGAVVGGAIGAVVGACVD